MTSRAATSREAMRVEFGSRDIRIVAVSYEPPDGALENGAIRIDCSAQVAEPDLTIGIAVYDGDGTVVLGTNSKLLGVRVPLSAPMSFTARFALSCPLAPGQYSVTAALHVGLSHEEGCYHWCTDATRFVVAEKREGNERRGEIGAHLTVIAG
jgi:lipopolysaccharide transport system ATP-binding protein